MEAESTCETSVNFYQTTQHPRRQSSSVNLLTDVGMTAFVNATLTLNLGWGGGGDKTMDNVQNKNHV
jgi:hypothetical protein